MEQNFAEPLSEYGQFASIIKKLLQFRHQKHAQLEVSKDQLEAKRVSLEDLERTEREASRLEQALDRGRGDLDQSVNGEPSAERTHSQRPESEDENGETRYTPPHPTSGPPRRSGSGMGLLNALSYTIHGMMDSDPESARRNGISKTRETISQVRVHIVIMCPPCLA
jgi:sorting nexin-41/42